MSGYSVCVNTKWCKSCGICVAFCPKKVLALTEKKKLFVENEAACIGCKMCENRCPDMAINIIGKEQHANG